MLDDIISITQSSMEPLIAEGYRLQTNWWNGLRDKNSHPTTIKSYSHFGRKLSKIMIGSKNCKSTIRLFLTFFTSKSVLLSTAFFAV